MTEKRDISVKSVTHLDRREVIVLLYLLHYPSHPYKMAKAFRDAEIDGRWKVPKTKDLSRANKVYKICDNLVKKGLLIRGEPEGGRGRTPYRIDPMRLFEIVPHESCLLESYEHMLPLLYKDEDMNEVHKDIIKECFDAITKLSKSPYELIYQINKIHAFDLTTFLLHIDKLLAEIEEYLHKWEPIIDYHKADLMVYRDKYGLIKITEEEKKSFQDFIHNSLLDWEGWLKRHATLIEQMEIVLEKIKQDTSKWLEAKPFYEKFMNAYQVPRLMLISQRFHEIDKINLMGIEEITAILENRVRDYNAWFEEGLYRLQSFHKEDEYYEAYISISDIRNWLKSIIDFIMRSERGLS
ncbi:MAG: hypothetical protein QXP55_05395 [Nitrososphaerales archaeon]